MKEACSDCAGKLGRPDFRKTMVVWCHCFNTTMWAIVPGYAKTFQPHYLFSTKARAQLTFRCLTPMKKDWKIVKVEVRRIK